MLVAHACTSASAHTQWHALRNGRCMSAAPLPLHCYNGSGKHRIGSSAPPSLLRGLRAQRRRQPAERPAHICPAVHRSGVQLALLVVWGGIGAQGEAE